MRIEGITGGQLFKKFFEIIRGGNLMWDVNQTIFSIKDAADRQIKGKIVMGFSGGLHSCVLAAILQPMFGKNLLAICVNHGGFRKDELAEIKANAKAVGIESLRIVDAGEPFIGMVGTTVDGEEKRNLFENLCNELLCCEALDFHAKTVALSRRNYRLNEWSNLLGSKVFSSFYPFQDYSRERIIRMAESLHLPANIIRRPPSPTVGLFIRIIGMPVNLDNLALLRWADGQTTEILKNRGMYKNISQLVVAITPGKSTIAGGRYSVIIRPMISPDDFVSAKGYYLLGPVWSEIESTLLANDDIVRVMYDGTKKPPASIELE